MFGRWRASPRWRVQTSSFLQIKKKKIVVILLGCPHVLVVLPPVRDLLAEVNLTERAAVGIKENS